MKILVPNAHAAAVTGLVFMPHSHSHSQPRLRSTDIIDSADDEDEKKKKKKKETDMYIVSSSTDQRVKTWRVAIASSFTSTSTAEKEKGETCPIDIEMVGDEFTAVSDIGDVGLIPGDDGNGAKAIIVGNGMEIWGFGETKSSFEIRDSV